MKKSLWIWIGWFTFLFVLDFTLPFLVFDKVPTIKGSFLFWLLWVIVAIVSMFIIFLQWRDDKV